VMADLALEKRQISVDGRDIPMTAAEFRGGFNEHGWRRGSFPRESGWLMATPVPPGSGRTGPSLTARVDARGQFWSGLTRIVLARVRSRKIFPGRWLRLRRLGLRAEGTQTLHAPRQCTVRAARCTSSSQLITTLIINGINKNGLFSRDIP
jgi:hypothetical protein